MQKDTIARAIELLRVHDPTLGTIIDRGAIPSFLPNTNYYEALVDSIISQQLSVKAAATILKRFVELFPGKDFPEPTDILQKDIEDFRAVGLSRQKAGYIQDLAVKVIDRTVQFDHLDGLTNEEVIKELTLIKGVGVWTAHMFLMFCMGRLNVLPVGDLGIRNGIQKLYGLSLNPTPEDIESLAKKNKWSPYESIASWYIWQSLDNKPAL
jgi:DNA-3-methyladenine glycosylase II